MKSNTVYRLVVVCALAATLVGVLAFTAAQAGAQTEPLGGQPALGSSPSVPDLDAQVAYQRAFEAVLWAMPASAIYRFRVGAFEIPGAGDNVVIAYSAPITQLTEAITGNTVTPYIVTRLPSAERPRGAGSSNQERQGEPLWADCGCLAVDARRCRACWT